MNTPTNVNAGKCSVDRPVRKCYCGRPIATPKDWDFYQPGEGAHLCWGECGVSAEEAWWDAPWNRYTHDQIAEYITSFAWEDGNNRASIYNALASMDQPSDGIDAYFSANDQAQP